MDIPSLSSVFRLRQNIPTHANAEDAFVICDSLYSLFSIVIACGQVLICLIGRY
jgi:hypothetical protein